MCFYLVNFLIKTQFRSAIIYLMSCNTKLLYTFVKCVLICMLHTKKYLSMIINYLEQNKNEK